MELDNIQQSDTLAPDGDDIITPAQMNSLAELLAEPKVIAPDGADNKDGQAGGNADKNAKPEMFNDLAGTLGIELDDLYKLKVSTVDGKTVSIEELKTLQASADNISIRELEFEESRVSKEGDIRQAQTEIAEIVAALPNGTLKPEVLEKLRAKNAARTEIEQTRTMKAIPSWHDSETRKQDMVGMVTHLERFGFPVDYLASITDHRQLVFIRESFLREQRIKNALERVRAGAPNPKPATTVRGNAKQKPRAVTRKNSNTRNGLEAFFSEV